MLLELVALVVWQLAVDRKSNRFLRLFALHCISHASLASKNFFCRGLNR
jgi:hypothetical protein